MNCAVDDICERAVDSLHGRSLFNQTLDYLPLNDAEIVVRVIEDEPKTEGNGGAP
jgi:hypothetical protein